MFERLLANGVSNVMLEVQYRMHDVIRRFPSDQFYQGRLRDAESVVARKPEGPLQKITGTFKPIQFFDLAYSVEENSETSKVNTQEVAAIEQLVWSLIASLVGDDISAKHSNVEAYLKQSNQTQLRVDLFEKLKGLIGIVTPYKSQVRALKDRLFKLLRQSFDVDRPLDYIEVNTVDGYQGREKDIIIFSCVRSNAERQLGFTADYRRMNVAITRARHCLFLFGNSATL